MTQCVCYESEFFIPQKKGKLILDMTGDLVEAFLYLCFTKAVHCSR